MLARVPVAPYSYAQMIPIRSRDRPEDQLATSATAHHSPQEGLLFGYCESSLRTRVLRSCLGKQSEPEQACHPACLSQRAAIHARHADRQWRLKSKALVATSLNCLATAAHAFRQVP